jgi:hypothetical protein
MIVRWSVSGSPPIASELVFLGNGMGIRCLSQCEAIDTEGPLGRAILVIVSAMAELELYCPSRGNQPAVLSALIDILRLSD